MYTRSEVIAWSARTSLDYLTRQLDVHMRYAAFLEQKIAHGDASDRMRADLANMRMVIAIESAQRTLRIRRNEQREISESWHGKTTAESEEEREYARHTVRLAEIALKRVLEQYPER